MPPAPPSLTAIAARHPAVEEWCPCLYDATTNIGLGPLRRALPDGWIEAFRTARAHLPPLTRRTTLRELLRRGSARCLPSHAGDIAGFTKRRRSLAQLLGLHDELPLEDIDAARLAALFAAYRDAAPERPGRQASADRTELRHLVKEARSAVGLAPLARPPRRGNPKDRRAPPPRRPVAELEEVHAAIRAALTAKVPRRGGGRRRNLRWLAGFLAIQFAVPLLPGELLGLRRDELKVGPEGVTLARRADAKHPVGVLLPAWAADLLDAALPDWRSLRGDAPLFPGRDPARPRREYLASLKMLSEFTGCTRVAPARVRRLGQIVHRGLGAPRAYVRGTARARFRIGTQELVGTDDRRVALAVRRHGATLRERWPVLAKPPVRVSRLPARAPATVEPHAPEVPRPSGPPPAFVPASLGAAPDGTGASRPRGAASGNGSPVSATLPEDIVPLPALASLLESIDRSSGLADHSGPASPFTLSRVGPVGSRTIGSAFGGTAAPGTPPPPSRAASRTGWDAATEKGAALLFVFACLAFGSTPIVRSLVARTRAAGWRTVIFGQLLPEIAAGLQLLDPAQLQAYGLTEAEAAEIVDGAPGIAALAGLSHTELLAALRSYGSEAAEGRA